jgi:two-component system chemotaxis sensor kinase CheA
MRPFARPKDELYIMSTNDDFFDRTEFVQYFRDETEELLQSIDSDLLRLERFVDTGTMDVEIVNALFRGLHTVKGSAGMLEFKDVAHVAHKLENLFDLLRKERMPLSEGCINLLFEGRDILTDLVHAAVGNGEPRDGVDEFIARLDDFATVHESAAVAIDGKPAEPNADRLEALAPVETAQVETFEDEIARLLAAATLAAGAAPAAVAAVTAVVKPSAASAAPVVAATAKHQTIRVDIERLDMLLNLVGELVINRTRISDIANTLARSLNQTDAKTDVSALAKDLAESSALLARTTNDIQESIMKVRMVPIGTVFERFPRMVRDLAKTRKKEVTLELNGGDTDLDKTIVDEVGEPLMHLVRNCVDHGIEEPDVRQAKGKPRAGILQLNAYHEGNQVIVEIVDDGGGIPLDKVHARAVKQGLITETDRPSDREIMEFIFAPGFSTAEQITDISGRGVGMEIVKKNITRLNGVFEVDSVLGKGTKFTIKLPLTLAIIRALLVRVANELYSIPLDAVLESQRIGARDVRTVHGSEVITLRGQVVPLIRVGEFFGLENPRNPDRVMIVIVGSQGRQVGLVVDSFQGEQEIVIKPLSDIIGAIAGISGATILGNGSISLILDVHSLVTAAHSARRSTRAQLTGVA